MWSIAQYLLNILHPLNQWLPETDDWTLGCVHLDINLISNIHAQQTQTEVHHAPTETKTCWHRTQ